MSENKTILNNDVYYFASILIQKWWRKYTEIKNLKKIYDYLLSVLCVDDLQELSNKCRSITAKCTGDGAGLTGGTLVDMLLCDFFKHKIPQYTDNHDGECDMKICDMPLSLKKINGKSTIALDWSKNENAVKREHFSCCIMIINLKTEKWWKNNPVSKNSKIKMAYNDTIPSGIYLIDKQFCKFYIKLSSNNKTNTLIESQYLYIMIKRSILLDLFIELPIPNKIFNFNILNAFS